MSTTTIRLPQDLKERVARAAQRAGTTAHSFILEAIAEKAEQDERRAHCPGQPQAPERSHGWAEHQGELHRQDDGDDEGPCDVEDGEESNDEETDNGDDSRTRGRADAPAG